MSEWTVVTALIAVVGLFLTVGKPIINLNTSIVTLNEEMKQQRERLNKMESGSVEEHQLIWDHEEQQDKELAEHRIRLHDLDGK